MKPLKVYILSTTTGSGQVLIISIEINIIQYIVTPGTRLFKTRLCIIQITRACN
jgi:hypothetical protein